MEQNMNKIEVLRLCFAIRNDGQREDSTVVMSLIKIRSIKMKLVSLWLIVITDVTRSHNP